MILTALALIAAQTVPDDRPVLWGNLRIGMKGAEVKPLLPAKRRVMLTDTCGMDIEPEYWNGGLKSLRAFNLTFGNFEDRAACADIIFDGLVKKYGEPYAIEDALDRVGSKGTSYLFRGNGVRVNMIRDKVVKSSFDMTYSQDQTTDVSGKL